MMLVYIACAFKIREAQLNQPLLSHLGMSHLHAVGDTSDEMVVAIAAVTVGHGKPDAADTRS